MSFDLDDLFKKNKHAKHGHHDYHDHSDHHSRYEKYDSHKMKHDDYLQKIITTLLNDKKLLLIVVGGVLLLLIIAIFVIALTLPFIFQLLGSISKSGIKGIIDTLWLGTGK